jgi:glutamate carboxypeptidase
MIGGEFVNKEELLKDTKDTSANSKNQIMDVERAFKIIDLKANELKKIWIDMINIESNSNDKKGVDKLGCFIKGKAIKEGFVIKEYDFKKSGNGLAIFYENEGVMPPISLMAHMDTVHIKGEFGDPIVYEDSKYIYGPGALDCKGGIAIL